MRFLNNILWLLGLLLCFGCQIPQSSNNWVKLSDKVNIRTISEYTEGDYLQVRMDISEQDKNPVYATGKEGYDRRLRYFNSSILKDVSISGKNGERIYPFDMNTERNFGYKNYLTVLFFFSVEKEQLDEIDHIQFFDNCFGIGKVKLEFKLQ